MTTKIGFDTGTGLGTLELDSTFCADNPLPLWQREPELTIPQGGGIAWVYKRPKGNLRIFDGRFKVKIGQTNVDGDALAVEDNKSYLGESERNGYFNLTRDTVNVWELNFEHNYIELHKRDTFTAPSDCLAIPIKKNPKNGKIGATIPMKITTSDGDTLTINQDFLVDTGMGWDLCIAPPAKELYFFEGKEAVSFGFGGGGYVNRHIVDATIFGDFQVDSLRIYTLRDRVRLSSDYYIGLNFLKRFNVFIDLKNAQMLLQPLKEYTRAFSPKWKIYNLSATWTKTGSYIVTDLSNNKSNRYRAAGLRVGDEVVGINGTILTMDIANEKADEFFDNRRNVLDIVRDGKRMIIAVEPDLSEKDGD